MVQHFSPNTHILVASYGGSGSAQLVELLKQALPPRSLIEHAHGAPEDHFLGIPIPYQQTGQAHGPFSQWIELPRSVKVVVIYRKPAEAYFLTAGYEHYLKMWSATKKMEIFNSSLSPSLAEFQEEWHRCQVAGIDVMHLRDWLLQWRHYAQFRRHDICFVKQESLELTSIRNCLARFISSDLSETSLDALLSPPTDVSDQIQSIFSCLQSDVDQWPSFEIFNQSSATPDVKSDKRFASLDSPLNFVIIPPYSGASDALSRIGLAHDIVAQNFRNATIKLNPYKNYHSSELNWFDLFGLTDELVLDGHQSHPVVSDPLPSACRITLSELIWHILYDVSYFDKDITFEIIADLYSHDWRIQWFRRYRDFRSYFLQNLSYYSLSDPFRVPQSEPNEDSFVKVVAHLRRADISGSQLFDSIPEDVLPAERRKGVASRSLLQLDHIVQALEENLPQGSSVKLIIASDGFETLLRRFGHIPELQENITKLQHDLTKEMPPSNQLQITIVDRFIGTDAVVTRSTLDAMCHADLVISASSTFPRLICSACKTRLLLIPENCLLQGCQTSA